MVELEEKKKVELLSPKIDVVFHALFRKENKNLAEKFISALLGRKVRIKNTDLNRHLQITSANEKLGVLDYITEFEDLTKCNIEIQVLEKDYEIERFLYYWANIYSRQLERGEEYNKLYKTISIIILDHELDVLKNFNTLNTKWQIRADNLENKLLTEHLEICIIEIPKAKRMFEKMIDNEICQWMWFLDEPNSEEVSRIMKKNTDIKFAAEELEYVSEDEMTRKIAELREKGIRDEKAARSFAMRKGLEEGREKGMKEGMKEGIKEMVIKMLNKNMDINLIKEISGLNEQKITEIKEQGLKNN